MTPGKVGEGSGGQWRSLRWGNIFHEREVLLRSNDRVRLVRIGRGWQLAAGGVAVALLLWAVTASTVALVQRQALEDRAQTLRETRLAYEDLVGEVDAYRRKVAAATAELKAGQANLSTELVNGTDGPLPVGGTSTNSGTETTPGLRRQLARLDIGLEELATVGEMLGGSLRSIRADLAAVEVDGDKVYEARAALKERIKDLERTILESRAEGGRLRAEAAELKHELKQVRTALQAAQALAGDRQARLDAAVARAQNERAQSLSEREAAAARMADIDRARKAAMADAVRLRKERADLEARLAAADGVLADFRQRNARLERDLEKVVHRLQVETGEPLSASLAVVPLSERVATLLSRLAHLHAAHGTMLEGLNARASVGIEDAERIIARTGMDVDSLLERVPAALSHGQGGPFVPTAAADPSSYAGQVVHLDTSLSRLEALRLALGAMPLVAPLDQYRITSMFGRRTDPLNKTAAMHAGVDLGGYAGSSVRASAPGTVLSAGWNGPYGRMVEIDHGFGFVTRYAHLRSIDVKRGETVAHRQKIGVVGQSGRATGLHVHYEVLFDGTALDPMKFIEAGKNVFKE